jgi:hypothetical protein
LGRRLRWYSGINQTPDKSGMDEVARDFAVLACCTVWENVAGEKINAAAARISPTK